MKIISLVALIFILSTNCFSATITAAQNGNWNVNSTWDCNCQPQDGDLIIIPAGITVTVPTDFPLIIIDLRGPSTTIVQVAGTLNLEAGGIRIDNADGDKIEVLSGGNITGLGGIFFDNDPWWNPSVLVTGSIAGPATIQNGVLPIELLSFNAKLSGEIVDISWVTASEIDNDFFTLERSEDAINWSIIGEVMGAGNSNVKKDYKYSDYNPIPGLSYYRLKQTDYDGKFEYFTPAVILYEPDNLFKIFPNPTTDILQISTSSDLDNATILVKNLNGQTIEVSNISASTHQATLDISNLPAGVYLLEIVFLESVLSKRIVKQ